MEYSFKIHKEKKGYWAEGVELGGCRAQAETLEDLKTSLQEALNLYLSESDESLIEFPMPQKSMGKNIILIEVDPGVALSVLIRQARLRRKLTQKQMMAVMGIKTLSNYQRLENPKKSNPEFKTLIQIQKAIPELKVDMIINSYKKKSA